MECLFNGNIVKMFVAEFYTDNYFIIVNQNGNTKIYNPESWDFVYFDLAIGFIKLLEDSLYKIDYEDALSDLDDFSNYLKEELEEENEEFIVIEEEINKEVQNLKRRFETKNNKKDSKK